MQEMSVQLFGFCAPVPDADWLRAKGAEFILSPSGRLGALIGPENLSAREHQTSLIEGLEDRGARALPARACSVPRHKMVGYLAEHEGDLLKEMDRISGRRELLLSLWLPVPPAPRLHGTAVQRLKLRGNYLRDITYMRRDATARMQALADQIAPLADAWQIAPFGASVSGKVGAELLVLVRREKISVLTAQLAQIVQTFLPNDMPSNLEIEGEALPIGFLAHLPPMDALGWAAPAAREI